MELLVQHAIRWLLLIIFGQEFKVSVCLLDTKQLLPVSNKKNNKINDHTFCVPKLFVIDKRSFKKIVFLLSGLKLKK